MKCLNCDEQINPDDAFERIIDGMNCNFCGEECADYYDQAMEDAWRADLDHDRNDPDAYLIDGVGFADPGGRSALRAETPDNPRDQPCPTCGTPNALTRIDKQHGYQCDRCADIDEGRIVE